MKSDFIAKKILDMWKGVYISVQHIQRIFECESAEDAQNMKPVLNELLEYYNLYMLPHFN